MTDLDPAAQMQARRRMEDRAVALQVIARQVIAHHDPDKSVLDTLVEAFSIYRAKGASEERAAIVAWLRQSPHFINSHGIADAIEAGEHIK